MNLGKSLNLSEPASSSVKWGYDSIRRTGWRHPLYLPSGAPNEGSLCSQPSTVMTVTMLTIVARGGPCWPCPAAWGVPWEWGFLLRNPRAAQPWHAAGLRAVHLVPLTLASASAQNFRGFSEKTPRLMVAVCRASLGGRSFPSLCTCPGCLLTVLAFLPILQRSRGLGLQCQHQALVLVPVWLGFWQVFEGTEVVLTSSVPKLAELSAFWISCRLCLLSDLWAKVGGTFRGWRWLYSPPFPSWAASALGSLREFSGGPRRPALLPAQAHLVPGCGRGRPSL